MISHSVNAYVKSVQYNLDLFHSNNNNKKKTQTLKNYHFNRQRRKIFCVSLLPTASVNTL